MKNERSGHNPGADRYYTHIAYAPRPQIRMLRNNETLTILRLYEQPPSSFELCFGILLSVGSENNKPVVILTELKTNPGMSVTNQAEDIIAYLYGGALSSYRSVDQILWVEHYEHEDTQEDTFDFIHPKAEPNGSITVSWTKGSREEIDKLINR